MKMLESVQRALKHLHRSFINHNNEIILIPKFNVYTLLDVVEELLKKFPTADVAPKSEDDKEIVGYIEKHLQYQRKKVGIPFTSRDMRNYQCGAIDVIEYFEELIAELKKKYTEDKG
jgi:hypothetical protein